MDSDESTSHSNRDITEAIRVQEVILKAFRKNGLVRERTKRFPETNAGITAGNVEERDEGKGAESKDVFLYTPIQKTRDVNREWRHGRGKEVDVGAYRNVRPATPGNRVQNTPIKNVRVGPEMKHVGIQTSAVPVSNDDYGSLMETFIPNDEDWIEFGKKYLMVEERDLSRAKRRFRGEQLKEEILRLWITKYGGEATVSKAYGLAHKFRNDELEEVFRFLAKLIPDAREWKNFANYGLKLEKGVYKEYEDEISNEQKLQMLRQWRQREGNDSGVDGLCVAVRTHFEGNPMLVNFCKAAIDPLYEGQKAISAGVNKLREMFKGMSMGNVHVQNYGTLNCRDPFFGCQGTSIDY